MKRYREAAEEMWREFLNGDFSSEFGQSSEISLFSLNVQYLSTIESKSLIFCDFISAIFKKPTLLVDRCRSLQN